MNCYSSRIIHLQQRSLRPVEVHQQFLITIILTTSSILEPNECSNILTLCMPATADTYPVFLSHSTS